MNENLARTQTEEIRGGWLFRCVYYYQSNLRSSSIFVSLVDLSRGRAKRKVERGHDRGLILLSLYGCCVYKVSFSDISAVHLILGWNLFGCEIERLISSIPVMQCS